MKKLTLAALLAFALTGASTAFAADAAASAPMTAQQSKMGDCNKQAADKKGDDRKAFMKECLSAKKSAQEAQREKMKTCNKDAAGKKGDERKAFMKDCLSK